MTTRRKGGYTTVPLRVQGYTLVEMMVVTVLISVLTIGVVGMFVSLLKGQSKTQALARLKEEGDYASSTIERILREGEGLGTIPQCIDNQQVVVKRKAKNSLNVVIPVVVTVDTALDAVTNNKVLRLNTDDPDADINLGQLTRSEHTISGTFVTRCVEGGSLYQPDKVLIQFTLTDPNSGVSIPFSTYVLLRNSKP